MNAREKIAAAASEHGWTLAKQMRGVDTYESGDGKSVRIEFSTRGVATHATVKSRAGQLVGTRIAGAGKAEQVIEFIEKKQEK